MRLPALLACALTVLLPGCLQGVDLGPGSAGMDCSSDVQQAVGQEADLLVPPQTPEGVPNDNPSVTVSARAGQTVTAQATWIVQAGVAQESYDGPPGEVTVGTAITWQSIARDVPAGNVTLGIAGDPFAFGVTYTLQLMATGCTPRA